MSKPIKLTAEYLDECRKDFEKALTMTKLSDGKISFTKVFSCGDQKATVYFAPVAFAKMSMLIKEFDKEVAWHGIARRADDDTSNDYIIDDIVVYPQEVTGATVEMDTEKYATWIQDNIEDERFNHIYMQGHSHVNMTTSPSSVDLNHQDEILGMLGDDDFYIFMIWNKSFTSTNKIYDLKKNILFEDRDITVKILGQPEGLDKFLSDAKEMVKNKVSSYATPNTFYKDTPMSKSASPYNPLYSGNDVYDQGSLFKSSTPSESHADKTRTRIGCGWRGRMYEHDDATEYYGGK